MITKEDWNDAIDAFAAEMCETLGGTPTHEEAEAFYAGALAPDDAERIRARIIYCGLAPFPEVGDEVTAADIERSLEQLKKRLNTPT
jgi:hypothetical protein